MADSFPALDELQANTLLNQIQALTGTGEFAEVGALKDLAPLEAETRSAFQRGELGLYQESMFGDTATADDQGRVFMGYEYEAPEGLDLRGYSLIKVSNKYILKDPAGNQVAYSGQADGWRNVIDAVKNNKTMGGTLPPPDVIEALEASMASPTQTRKPVYQTGYTPGEEVQISKGMVDLMGPSKAKTVDPETGDITYGRAGYDAQGQQLGASDIEMQQALTRQEQQAYGDIDLAKKFVPELTKQIRETGDVGARLEDIGRITDTNIGSLQGAQRQLEGEAASFLGMGLSDREQRDIRQASRQAGAATGRIRDFGRVVDEATAITEGNRQRRIENMQAAMAGLGSAAGMGSEAQRQGIAALGTELQTAVNPSMFMNAPNPSQAGVLMTGKEFASQPAMFDPNAGVEFGFNRQQQINQGKLAKRGQNMGLIGAGLSGLASIGSSMNWGQEDEE